MSIITGHHLTLQQVNLINAINGVIDRRVTDNIVAARKENDPTIRTSLRENAGELNAVRDEIIAVIQKGE